MLPSHTPKPLGFCSHLAFSPLGPDFAQLPTTQSGDKPREFFPLAYLCCHLVAARGLAAPGIPARLPQVTSALSTRGAPQLPAATALPRLPGCLHGLPAPSEPPAVNPIASFSAPWTAGPIFPSERGGAFAFHGRVGEGSRVQSEVSCTVHWNACNRAWGGLLAEWRPPSDAIGVRGVLVPADLQTGKARLGLGAGVERRPPRIFITAWLFLLKYR